MQLFSYITLLLVEVYLMYRAQRLPMQIHQTRLKRWALYILVMPGTVLHETSHAAMCVLLGVRITKFIPFWPRVADQGVTLGYVQHESPGPLRSTLIAIAPLLFVPLFMLTIVFFSTGSIDPGTVFSTTIRQPWWQIIGLGYIIFSAGKAAFPSPGDRISLLGIIFLLPLIAGGILFLIEQNKLFDAVKTLALFGILPAVAAGAWIILERERI